MDAKICFPQYEVDVVAPNLLAARPETSIARGDPFAHTPRQPVAQHSLSSARRRLRPAFMIYELTEIKVLPT